MRIPVTLNPEDVHRRRDLHAQLGGQRQGGISTPRRFPIVLLFTSDGGQEFGYYDRWSSKGTFFYTGEGQHGDMQWVRGNAAIRDHSDAGKDLALFSEVEPGHHRFVGYFACVSWSYEQRPDRSGTERSAIVFELAPLKAVADVLPEFDDIGDSVNSAELLRRAVQAARSEPRISTGLSHREYRRRSQAIVDYALDRSNGSCELCRSAAPFQTRRGIPYLEVHHIRRLSDGGPDDPRFVAAICPNCHREVHHGADGEAKNKALQSHVAELVPHLD